MRTMSVMRAGKGTMQERNWQSLKEEITAPADGDEDDHTQAPSSVLDTGGMSDVALRKRDMNGSDRV